MKHFCIALLAILLLRSIDCCTGFPNNGDLLLGGDFDFFVTGDFSSINVPGWDGIKINSSGTFDIMFFVKNSD